MHERIKKQKENKNSVVVNPVAHKKSSLRQGFGFADNRPETRNIAQLQTVIDSRVAQQHRAIQNNESDTGLPYNLKTGIENLSGHSMDDVKVHYDSNMPAQLKAHAYAKGTDIYIASGQETYLPHEAWHVVQQKQGLVKPTLQMKGGVNLNNDERLENEADLMGQKALQMATEEDAHSGPFVDTELNPAESQNKSRAVPQSNQKSNSCKFDTVQRKIIVGTIEYDAKEAEHTVREADIKWRNVYGQVLASLDAKDERFKSVSELMANLELNGKDIEKYKNEAVEAWEVYSWGPGEKDSLHDLAYKVIANAIDKNTAVAGMSYDKVFKYTPETQIAYCLWECRNDTAETLALCLYTSYFYQPLNQYFRGQGKPDENTDFGKLVLKTAEVLKDSYKNEEETIIDDKRYRLELKSGWINDDQKIINFAAATSTHPNLNGVKGMWADVGKKTFGDYDNFALLSFEGTARTKRPVKKYFPGESEDLMAPGSSYNVIDRYDIEGDIPGIGRNKIRVFRLSNVKNQKNDKERLAFNDVV